jgi:hypothetical protein
MVTGRTQPSLMLRYQATFFERVQGVHALRGRDDIG